MWSKNFGTCYCTSRSLYDLLRLKTEKYTEKTETVLHMYLTNYGDCTPSNWLIFLFLKHFWNPLRVCRKSNFQSWHGKLVFVVVSSKKSLLCHLNYAFYFGKKCSHRPNDKSIYWSLHICYMNETWWVWSQPHQNNTIQTTTTTHSMGTHPFSIQNLILQYSHSAWAHKGEEANFA